MQHKASRLTVMDKQCVVHQIHHAIPNVYEGKIFITFTKFHTSTSQSHCELLIPSSSKLDPLSPLCLLSKNLESSQSPP
jgi:hypothetical protein